MEHQKKLKVVFSLGVMLISAWFGGCGMVPIEPYPEAPEVHIPAEIITTMLTTTETTVTTTTTNVYTPPDEPALLALLSEMTLQEKAAQMLVVGCSDAGTAEAVCAQGAGGLCLFAPPFADKNPEQVKTMVQGFQTAAKIPVLVSVDEEGGGVTRVSQNPQLREKRFWSPRYLFANGGWDLIERDTLEKAVFLLDLGINVNLAPVCDVPLHETDYIYGRCFGMDAAETAKYVQLVVGMMKQQGIGCTLKHFPGYGGSGDTHKNMAYDDREYEAFTSRDLIPFAAGIEAGADSVMVTHNIVVCMDATLPASLSPVVHQMLRETMGFRGVIITDDLGMNAIKQFTNGENPAVAAVKAGNDLLCYADFASSVQAIVAAVQAGEIEESQLDASVLRILYWKQTLGLLPK